MITIPSITLCTLFYPMPIIIISSIPIISIPIITLCPLPSAAEDEAEDGEGEGEEELEYVYYTILQYNIYSSML